MESSSRVQQRNVETRPTKWRPIITVICWDGRTLAADKQASTGGLKATTTKIFRVGATLVGFSGNLSTGMEMLQWLRDGADPAKFPAAQKTDDSVDVIQITPGGAIRKYEKTPYPMTFEDKTFAIGCGRDFAIAAMSCGCDARRAVEVACEHDAGCGMGIDTLTLEPLQ